MIVAPRPAASAWTLKHTVGANTHERRPRASRLVPSDRQAGVVRAASVYHCRDNHHPGTGGKPPSMMVAMGDRSSIEWTEATWNPTTGCDRTSPGCDHCYALTLSKRLKAMGMQKYQRDGDPRTSGPGFGLDPSPGRPRPSEAVGSAENGLCQLDERSVPRSDPHQLHRSRLRCHGVDSAAHLSVAHQTLEASRQDGSGPRLASQCLDGRQRRERSLFLPCGPPSARCRLRYASCRSSRCSDLFRALT